MPAVSSSPIRVRRPGRPSSPLAPWTALVRLYRQIGLVGRAEQIEAVLERSAALTSDAGRLSADLADLEVRSVFRVMAGDSPLSVAVDLDAARRLAGGAAPLVGELIDKARRQLEHDLACGFWEAGDVLVAECDAVVKAAATEVLECRARLGSISSAGAAIGAGVETSQAWKALVDAHERAEAAWSICTALRLAEIAATVRGFGELDWQFQRAELVVRGPVDEAPPLAFARHVEAGAGPWCPTADQLVEAINA